MSSIDVRGAPAHIRSEEHAEIRDISGIRHKSKTVWYHIRVLMLNDL